MTVAGLETKEEERALLLLLALLLLAEAAADDAGDAEGVIMAREWCGSRCTATRSSMTDGAT